MDKLQTVFVYQLCVVMQERSGWWGVNPTVSWALSQSCMFFFLGGAASSVLCLPNYCFLLSQHSQLHTLNHKHPHSSAFDYTSVSTMSLWLIKLQCFFSEPEMCWHVNTFLQCHALLFLKHLVGFCLNWSTFLSSSLPRSLMFFDVLFFSTQASWFLMTSQRFSLVSIKNTSSPTRTPSLPNQLVPSMTTVTSVTLHKHTL